MSTAKLMRSTTACAASAHAASRRAAGRTAVLLGLAVASLAFPAATALRAQAPGTVTLGLFGQRTAFDQLTTLRFGTSPGIGGMVGVHVFRGLVVEAATSYTWTSPAAPPRVHASWMPYRARAVYHVPVTENFFPIIGAGLVRNDYSDAVVGTDSGFTGMLGFKTYVRDRVAFRSEVHMDVVGAPFNEGDDVNGSTVGRHVNWNLTAGMSIDFGPGRFRDTDQDRVRDRLDLCPDTPFGVGVDTDGCRLDADADRVFDEDDACPGTPIGVSVDARGCRLDGDGDRVFDEDDRCPLTPRNAGIVVDTFGCAVDTDLDRVPDFRDSCPGTPEGVAVDALGCRLDSDADGVFDEDDRCPNTAPGVEVDSSGCQVLFVEEQAVLVLEGVTFETASADLTTEAQAILDGVATALIDNAGVRVRVNGHTDATGDRAYNLILSQNRAESVVAYLASRGVDATRMEAQGFGPDQPVATNDTADGRRLNRRVELERIDP